MIHAAHAFCLPGIPGSFQSSAAMSRSTKKTFTSDFVNYGYQILILFCVPDRS